MYNSNTHQVTFLDTATQVTSGFRRGFWKLLSPYIAMIILGWEIQEKIVGYILDTDWTLSVVQYLGIPFSGIVAGLLVFGISGFLFLSTGLARRAIRSANKVTHRARISLQERDQW